MISYNFYTNFIKNKINTRVVPCENYLNILEKYNINKDDFDNLEDFENFEKEKNKKKLNDINDGLSIIIKFLNNKDLYNLSLIDKFHKNKIMKNEEYKKRIFEYKINNIPIYRSYIHKMGDERTNPVRYIWLKKDFTIDEKAKINNRLLLNCASIDFFKYNELRIIFTLYENGLLCQLPSYSGMIKTNSKDPYLKEHTYIICFKSKPDYYDFNENIDLNENSNFDLYTYTEIKENEKKVKNKKFEKIYYFNSEYEDINLKNINEKKEYEYVLENMIEQLNYINETDSENFNFGY